MIRDNPVIHLSICVFLSDENIKVISMMSMLHDKAGILVFNEVEGYVNCSTTELENE